MERGVTIIYMLLTKIYRDAGSIRIQKMAYTLHLYGNGMEYATSLQLLKNHQKKCGIL